MSTVHKLERVGPNHWRFRWSRSFREESEKLDSAIDQWQAGQSERAVRMLRGILRRQAEHLDAMHHLALVLADQEREEEALLLWEEAAALGGAAFPPGAFQRGRDLLEWAWLENRPFLRCPDGLMHAYGDAGLDLQAIDLGRELLALNPNDNHSVRCVLADMLLDAERYAEVVEALAPYGDDFFPQVLYGRALALFALSRFDEADDALRGAIERLPLVAEELLKDERPPVEGSMPGYETVSGPDQAYNYWDAQGDCWLAPPGALKWLKRVHVRLAEPSRP